MSINAHKSSITHNGLSRTEIDIYVSIFPLKVKSLMESLKYLGFLSNSNSYKKIELEMVIAKIEKRVKH